MIAFCILRMFSMQFPSFQLVVAIATVSFSFYNFEICFPFLLEFSVLFHLHRYEFQSFHIYTKKFAKVFEKKTTKRQTMVNIK